MTKRPRVTTLTAERDALQRHFDAAAPEHNLPALLDLYFERQQRAEKERDEARGLLRDVDTAWSDCLLTEDQADVLERIARHLEDK